MKIKIKKKKQNNIFCSVVIPAAGSSERMGKDKLFEVIDGKQVIVHTLLAFEHSPDINEIILVARAERIRDLHLICEFNHISKVTNIVLGGDSRAESVYNGLMSVSKKANLIAIHDGARPLVSQEIIHNGIELAIQNSAVVPYVPLKDTVKAYSRGKVLQTIDRSTCVAVQTPQIFDPVVIKTAMKNAIDKKLSITDDASAVEIIGVPVYLYEGDEKNIKLTTPVDIIIAKMYFAMRNKTNEVKGK